MNGESVIWNPSRLLFRIASAWWDKMLLFSGERVKITA